MTNLTMTKDTSGLSYPTFQKHDVLNHLARHEILTINQLVYLLYGKTSSPRQLGIWQASTRRTVRILRKQGYVHSTCYRPPGFRGQGKYPLASWLSKEGEGYAQEHFPATDPKSHGRLRSDLNLIHDMQRADTRIALYEMAERLGWQIVCKKNNLFHLVKPDDLYELTSTKTLHFFLEQERVKKDYKELHDKVLPYVRHHDTPGFKNLWGFRYFTVLVPMRDEQAVESATTHFGGLCNCLDPKLKRAHSKAPYLNSPILWFTTHDLLTKNPEGRIFLSLD